jgi:hypothetical protein
VLKISPAALFNNFLTKYLGATFWQACKSGKAVYFPRHDDLRPSHPESAFLAAEPVGGRQRPAADFGRNRLSDFTPKTR